MKLVSPVFRFCNTCSDLLMELTHYSLETCHRNSVDRWGLKMFINFTAQRVTKSTVFTTHVLCVFYSWFCFWCHIYKSPSLLYINSTKASNISRENGWTWSRECSDVTCPIGGRQWFSFPIGYHDRTPRIKQHNVTCNWTDRWWLLAPRPQTACSAFLQRCVTQAGLLPKRSVDWASSQPGNPYWHRSGAEGLPLRVLHQNTTLVGSLRLSLPPPPVFPMSDFKLGIVRLGRVAGKVSWIPGLPCAARKGPTGTATDDGNIAFAVFVWC